MKKILFPIFLFGCIFSFAQQTKDSSHNFHFYWGFAGAGQNFDKLNNRLAQRPEYEQLKDLFQAGITFGWASETNKVITDFHFSFYGGTKGDKEKKSSRLLSQDISLLLGYNFSKNENIRFYPFAGIGYQSFQAKLNRDLSAIPFDSVLASSSTLQRTSSANLSNGFFTYKLGMGIDFLNKKDHRIGLGIRAGYVGSFTRREWRINEDQVLFNAPKDHLSGWFISLQLMRGPRQKR